MERLRLTSIVKGSKADLLADTEIRANSIMFSEIDSNKVKFADGVHTYAELPYVTGALDDGDGAVYRFKGSLEKYSDLPTENNKAGDTWDVKEYGKNYTWTVDGEWDDIGGTIDLSNYATLDNLSEAVDTLNGSIDEESEARDSADTILSNRIDDVVNDLFEETTTRTNKDAELEDLISAEVSRATGAESQLNNDIVAENTRAINREEALEDLISNEAQRATDAESQLNNDIDDLNNAILDEVSNRESAISGLSETYYNKTEIDSEFDNYYTKSEINGTLDNYYVKDEVYSKEEADELFIKEQQDISGKIDKYSVLNNSNEEKGLIVQYVGDSETYKNGYFYKCVGEPYVDFTPIEDTYTITVNVTLEDFKALLTHLCEGRPFTAEDVTHGQIGYYNAERYSFSADTDDGNFFYITMTPAEFAEAGVTFEPPIGARQGVRFTCNLTNKYWKQINVQPQQDISGKADKSALSSHTNNKNNPHAVTAEQIGLGNVDNTSDVNKPISTATQTALNLKANSDDVYTKSQVYTKDEIDGKLTSAMRFKGTKPTYNDLPEENNQVGDMWNILDSGMNYAWDGENWDKLSETIDLSPYITKDDVFDIKDEIEGEINDVIGDLALETANRKDLANRIWLNYDETDNTKGWFYTKHNSNSGSFALLFNENDGGGSQVLDKTANIKSYVGTNLEEGNGGNTNAINVQIYSINDTTKDGVRINVNNHKAFYLKGSNRTMSDEHEIAVINDIPTTTSQLTNDSDFTTNEALQAQVASLTQQIKDLKLLIPQEVFDASTARSAMNASGKVTLCEDINLGVLNLGGGMFANYNTSINLNGHTLQAGPTGGRALLLVRGTSNYTFNGEGQVVDTADDSSPVWCASQNASVTINNGTFIAQGHTETIYCELGTITINGGEFKTESDDKRYLLNCKDANYQAGTAKIIVKGGKFWDFDPHNNTAEGAGTNFCADGYTTTSEEIDGHTVYTVVKA